MSKLPNHLGGHQNKTHVDEGALKWLIELGYDSLLDLGCGPGGQVRLAKSLGMIAEGVDGDPGCHPTYLHDFTLHPTTFPYADVIWSVEFFEHVEEKYVVNVFRTLDQICPKLIITSCAPPGAPGHHHVNCRNSEYWAGAFTAYGFLHKPKLTTQLRKASTMKRNFIRDHGRVYER